MKISLKLSHLFVLKCFFLALFSTVNAQSKSDTVYFDENWSICEKPVAEYFRVAELKMTNRLFFTGTITDYYLNGKILMKGFYDSNGVKQGLFTYLRKDGSLYKKGTYQNDDMKGVWNYYDEKDNLRVQFNCNTETDIVPVMIIDNNGDTILRNGNGHFIFNTLIDMPGVFTYPSFYTIEGQVLNSKKDGDFNYWLGNHHEKEYLYCTETYKNGAFKKLRKQVNKYGTITLYSPTKLLNLNSQDHLSSADNFSHSNIVFGNGDEGANKVVQYLIYGKEPEMEINTKSYRENVLVALNIIGKVLRKNLMNEFATNISYSYPIRGLNTNVLTFSSMLHPGYTPRKLGFTGIFSIDTSGYFCNSTFKGNLTADEITKINYYLSKVSGLAKSKINGMPVKKDLVVRIIAIIDTLTDKNLQPLVNCRYLAFSADSTDESVLTDEKIYSKVDFEARPVGGEDNLNRYISSNLNTYTPYQHGAPNDTYTADIFFTINEDGTVSDVRLKNDPGFGMGEEAIRIIKFMPDWIPARKDGKAVPFSTHKRITFKVERE